MSRCLTGIEVDCGTTGNDGFHGCCPSSLVCDPKAPNRICCPPGDDSCTEKALAAKPQPPCANGTWDLFDNGGYYCCEHGVQAYNRSNTNWCGKPTRLVSGKVVTLSLLREGVGMYECSFNGFAVLLLLLSWKDGAKMARNILTRTIEPDPATMTSTTSTPLRFLVW
jgi:hypothetical protein